MYLSKIIEIGLYSYNLLFLGSSASAVGAQLVAAVDEAKKVIQTRDIQVEEATVGDEGKDASILGVKSVAAVGEAEEVKEVVETGI